jgi:hypothetical protein
MPPMSILSAPPPPAPGGPPEPPAAPGSVPRLSLSTSAEKPAAAKPGVNIKMAAQAAIKVGGKPVVPPGKPGKGGPAVLRRRSALSPVLKVGIAVVIVALAIAGVFFYRIFFPAPAPIVLIKSPPIPNPAAKAAKDAEDALKKAAADKLAANALAAKRAEDKAKADALQEVPTPTPTPATESVMADSDLTTDVKVNSTHLDAAPAASAAFRTFVASASIGGVFQGTPSRALINGSIVREGQIVESSLAIVFDHIDADKKTIYFKDSTGAEVSKDY